MKSIRITEPGPEITDLVGRVGSGQAGQQLLAVVATVPDCEAQILGRPKT